VLSGDVKVAIRWQVSARKRYESDSSADVDNIVKPILDALCGPDGILIDDCQVQELVCYWSDGHSHPENEGVEIEMSFDPDVWMSKEGLVFLQVDRALYMPMSDDLPPSFVLKHAEHLAWRFDSAREMVNQGESPHLAYLTLPVQRVYHRSKIGAFRRATLEELRARLG
jgi:hypothetical protein